MKRRMWSLAFGLVCTGMALSVAGHAGWAPQRAQSVASMSALDLPGLKKPITKRFVNAKLSDVLAWLSLEQLSFVADAGEFPSQGQVTLSFKAQPLGAVLDAIADAYNGRWERRGDIFTLRPAGFRTTFDTGAAIATAVEPPRTALSLPGAIRTATSEPQLFRRTGTIAPSTGSAPLSTVRSAQGALTVPRVEGVPMLPSTSVRGSLTAPNVVTGALPQTRIASPGSLVAPSFVTTPRTTLAPSLIRPDVTIRNFTTAPMLPLTGVRTLDTGQDPKSHEEAMRAAEKALRAAEEHIRKMHESGEWRKHMERAMQEAHGSDAHRKAMEEAHKAMRDFHNSPEWKKAWEQAREEIRKALQSGKVKDGGKERAMTDKERAALEKSLEKMKDFKVPEFKVDEKIWKEMSKAETFRFVAPKEFDKKHFEEMMKNMPKFEGRFNTMPEFQKLDSERSRKIQEKIQELRKKSGMPPTFEMLNPEAFNKMRFQGLDKMKIEGLEKMKLEGLDKMKFEELKGLQGVKPYVLDSKKMRIVELIDSLSATQREKHEKQGYLTLEDLNPKQRAMLGDVPSDGNWTFSYSIEGKKLTIKNK